MESIIIGKFPKLKQGKSRGFEYRVGIVGEEDSYSFDIDILNGADDAMECENSLSIMVSDAMKAFYFADSDIYVSEDDAQAYVSQIFEQTGYVEVYNLEFSKPLIDMDFDEASRWLRKFYQSGSHMKFDLSYDGCEDGIEEDYSCGFYEEEE